MGLSIEDIFGMEHSNNGVTLIPLKELDNKDFNNVIKSFDLDINDFYKVYGKLHPYCYFKGTVYVEIYEMSKKHFNNFHIKERIVQQGKLHEKCIKNDEYDKLFWLIEKPLRFKKYQELFNQIPDNQKYEVFKDIYVSSEYGFNKLPKKFLKEIFKYNNSNKNWFKENVITIYRGEDTKSTSYTEAYSWTINEKIAFKFANRFGNEGSIYMGKVEQKDILDYIEDRGESEVLVYPENVFNIEEVY